MANRRRSKREKYQNIVGGSAEGVMLLKGFNAKKEANSNYIDVEKVVEEE